MNTITVELTIRDLEMIQKAFSHASFCYALEAQELRSKGRTDEAEDKMKQYRELLDYESYMVEDWLSEYEYEYGDE